MSGEEEKKQDSIKSKNPEGYFRVVLSAKWDTEGRGGVGLSGRVR